MDFKFTQDISPDLFVLKQNYTGYPLSYILPLRSQYSVRLYEILKQYKSTYQGAVKLTGIKTHLGAENYKTWQDFKRFTLEPALGLMNSKLTQGGN